MYCVPSSGYTAMATEANTPFSSSPTGPWSPRKLVYTITETSKETGSGTYCLRQVGRMSIYAQPALAKYAEKHVPAVDLVSTCITFQLSGNFGIGDG
ncbi:MAG: hypothetical protein EOP49_54255 [Sphingobacteriales bacterium]|nr:MAG: hypothetical protein EOP49_54255 [Sphingobacteriales bacterium]